MARRRETCRSIEDVAGVADLVPEIAHRGGLRMRPIDERRRRSPKTIRGSLDSAEHHEHLDVPRARPQRFEGLADDRSRK